MSTIFGNKIRTLREEKQIPQRQLAAALDIDTATYCKIEKGIRRAKREQVTILADFFEVDSKELMRLWSADKVYDIIAEEEEEATQILNVVAETIIQYKRKSDKV
jgi:transcriptional regulator with XRE-family HTH domain